MIKETSFYDNDFPVNIRIANVEEYPLHFHQDIEFIYVLKGEVNLKCGYFTYLLKEGDVFTINGREVHGLYRTNIDNIVSLVQIDNYFFSHYFKHLSASCYRTFTNDSSDSRFDRLKLLFIDTLSEALKKEPGYKHHIIDQINRLISHLNECFHYFSFEDKVVVNSRNDNPVFVERLSRIINYIYEHHSEKLTLEDLSRQEHLSTFYLSHMITDGTGMNFREFLCFARVEFSEMLLLDTNKKINVIAKEVGFSTTSYYIRYFQKWFGLTPDEYRKKYMNVIQTSGIPAKLKLTEPDVVLKLLHSNLEALNKQGMENGPAKDLRLDIQLDCATPSLRQFTLSLIPRCNISVLKNHFDAIVKLSKEFKIKELHIVANKETAAAHINQSSRYEELISWLKVEGISSKLILSNAQDEKKMFGFDSIAANPFILKLGLSPQCSQLTVNSLIDDFEGTSLLNGGDGIFTVNLIPKPSYFAYKSLQFMEGDLIHWGKYYAISRQNGKDGKPDSFCIVVYNQSDDTENLCKRTSSLEETTETLTQFDGVLDIGIRLNGLSGHYQIVKFRVTAENCLFYHAAKIGFSKRIERDEKSLLTWLVSPKINILTEEVRNSLYVNASLKGTESECIIITPI